jgi:hypothetical protein
MATGIGTVQFICDQAGLGKRLAYRKMFGEYALYIDGKVVALVCDDQLFLKPTPEGLAYLGSVSEDHSASVAGTTAKGNKTSFQTRKGEEAEGAQVSVMLPDRALRNRRHAHRKTRVPGLTKYNSVDSTESS